jgi:hypothetical protein
MFQLSSAGGNRLNAANFGENRLPRQIEARESLIAHDAGADGAVANPVLRFEQDHAQSRIREEICGVNAGGAGSDDCDVLQPASVWIT